MATDDLPFDSSVVADVREIIVREQGNDWTWSHKTGTTTTALGWLVGTTEFDGRMWVFAMNIDIEPAGSGVPIDPQARQSISRQILGEMGALPPG